MVLAHHVARLNSKRVVLASASPRRSELLKTLARPRAALLQRQRRVAALRPRHNRSQGLQFEVHVSSFDETLDKSSFASAADYARETALHKAIEVAQRRFADGQLADLVIAADTVVDASGEVLEKPDGATGATRMLTALSGSRHFVHTGVALVLPRATDPSLGVSPLVASFSETTEVEFAALSPELIAAYVATGEPFGKAGAYGIQGVAGSFVKRISGCYFNVVGLPLHRVSAELARLIQDGAL